MKTQFTTKIWQQGNNTGIVVPEKNLLELHKGKRPPVLVRIKNYTYASTIAAMDGMPMIPFAKEHRDKTGINGGESVEVTLTWDTSSRKMQLPEDATNAVKKAGLEEIYEKLAPSYQKEYVRSITEAKKPETRDARITKLISELSQKT